MAEILGKQWSVTYAPVGTWSDGVTAAGALLILDSLELFDRSWTSTTPIEPEALGFLQLIAVHSGGRRVPQILVAIVMEAEDSFLAYFRDNFDGLDPKERDQTQTLRTLSDTSIHILLVAKLHW